MLVDDQLFVKDEDKLKSTPLSVQECHQAKAPPLEDEEFLNGKLLNFRFVERSDELKFIKLRKQFSNYGLVNLSGRTFVIKPSNKQGRETYDFSSLKDLHEFHTPDTYRVIEETPRGDQERVVRFSETWIKHDQLCKRYTSVDFNLKPGFNDPSVFNMWTGFVKPIDGDADPFVNHIESLLVNESKTYAEAIYLIKLLAWVVQNPHMTVEILLLLIGPQGFGKSTVTEILRSLCPNHTATTSNLDNFMKWNGATANCKIIGLEEAFSNGNYLVRQQLKNAITNTWREIENKGQNPFYIPNVVFYIGTSNSDRPFSIDHDDRRTAVFAINKAGDTAYFDMFYDWLHNQGGNQIIMGYLLRLDLTGFNRKDIPNTKARAALKVNSLGAEDSFIVNLLSRTFDEQLGISDWSTIQFIPRLELYELYREHSKHSIDIRSFSANLAKLFNFPKGWADNWRSKPTTSKPGMSYYKIPPLQVSREYVAKHLKSSVENIFN